MTHDQNDQVVSKLFLTSASQPQNLTHEKWNTEIPLHLIQFQQWKYKQLRRFCTVASHIAQLNLLMARKDSRFRDGDVTSETWEWRLQKFKQMTCLIQKPQTIAAETCSLFVRSNGTCSLEPGSITFWVCFTSHLLIWYHYIIVKALSQLSLLVLRQSEMQDSLVPPTTTNFQETETSFIESWIINHPAAGSTRRKGVVLSRALAWTTRSRHGEQIEKMPVYRNMPSPAN